MKKYKVGVKEIWEQMYTVEAKNKSEAIEKIKNGEGEVCEEDNAFTYVELLEDCEPFIYGEKNV